jgi:hypothetical protein
LDKREIEVRDRKKDRGGDKGTDERKENGRNT